jgi:hypothetical protein
MCEVKKKYDNMLSDNIMVSADNILSAETCYLITSYQITYYQIALCHLITFYHIIFLENLTHSARKCRTMFHAIQLYMIFLKKYRYPA